nr:hypothetical protein [uncultured Flavobacterium sp.]
MQRYHRSFYNIGYFGTANYINRSAEKNDYIEIWGERFDGSGNMQTVSLNLTAR